jgi:hypothetical protein
VIPTEQALDRLRLLFREELRSALEETRRAAVLAEREGCAREADVYRDGDGCVASRIAGNIRRRPPP